MTTVTINKGTEGPSYDPYAYEEFEIDRPERVPVTVHVGLGVSIDGINYGDVDDNFMSAFETKVGISWPSFRRAIERLESPPRTCSTCGTPSYKGKYCSGYPGETFLICNKCDAILHVEFNESAIV